MAEKSLTLNLNKISEENLKRLFAYIESVQFGTVTLIIQNGEVVQIEKTEKFKLR